MAHTEYKKARNVCLAVWILYCVFALLVLTVGPDRLRYTGETEIRCGEAAGENVGPLLAGAPAMQTFEAAGGYVTQIDVYFQTFARSNTGEVTVELVDAQTGAAAAGAAVPMASLRDGSYQAVSLQGYVDIRGLSRPAVRISSSSQSEDDTVTVGIQRNAADASQEASVGGQILPGTALAVVVHAAGESPLYPFYLPGFLVLGACLLIYGILLLRALRRGTSFPGTGWFAVYEKYRFLIQQLISRDFKIKYKRSVLGVLWSFLNPLLMMLVQYLVFSNLFRFDIPNYAVYLLSGIVLFSGFSEMTTSAMGAITGNASLITKVYVPKYIYPVSKVLSTAINTGLSLIPLLLVALITGLPLRPALLLLPFGLLCYLLFIVGVSFALSSFMVFFRDIQFLWGVLTTIWMYATPIIYPVNILPKWLFAIEKFNPLYIYITYLRTVLIDGMAPEPHQYLACIAWAAAALLVGGWIFRRTEKNFVLYI